MTAPELKTFHLGIVVRDLEETVSQYSAMFDIERWHRTNWRFNGALLAYGMGPGISIELFEITAPGDSHIHQYWDQHGEGVHHVGIWAEDMASAVRKATDAGAELVSMSADADGNATAQLIPSSAVTEDQLAHLGLVSFVNPRGGVMFEYVGRAGEEFMRDWFKENYAHVVMGSPWSA
jgi:catechol 2,3-dioxygenase-like lactoylglutathione lyase family enzyme